jgi:hypothetical protein
MQFSYGEVGERTAAVQWRDRKELLKKVGTYRLVGQCSAALT